ncbi:DUF7289 family protein [Halorientalis salina]|uniref:DUF7289 family protein n=1 Tax=Halorientalis salina TaxID=2932266 RepID=UPI0010AC84CD|nr:hypothetical protein [Halorientalis salina]
MIRRDERAVTDVIGFILVFGLVATTVAIVSVSGLSTLQDARNAEQINNAERAFDVLADNMADIYQEGAPHRATEVSLDDATMNTATSVRINVSGEEKSSGDLETITNVQSRPVLWRSTQSAETEIAYSLGAVVRADRESGVMVNEPPFVLQDDRMLLTIVKTRTDNPKSLSGTTVRVRGNQERSSSSVLTGVDDSYDEVKINITSSRAGVWEQYFERKAITNSCSIDEETGRERVSCTLDAPKEMYVTVNGVNVELER